MKLPVDRYYTQKILYTVGGEASSSVKEQKKIFKYFKQTNVFKSANDIFWPFIIYVLKKFGGLNDPVDPSGFYHLACLF